MSRSRARNGLAAFVLTTAALALTSSGASADPTSTVFVNELHYDNVGADTGEAVEVAAPAGTDLTGWTLVLYNGSGGAPYGTVGLGGVVADQGGGYGTTSVAIVGLQNGSPDGLALVTPGGAVEQFLSYEGTFTAVVGPAAGSVSTDIGIAQAGSEPVGSSLALTGTGSTYGDFTWTAMTTSSFGAVNVGQTFSTSGPADPVAICPAALLAAAGTPASADVSATDADSVIATIAITSEPVDGITLVPTGAGSAQLDVATTTALGTYDVTIEFTTDDAPPQFVSCTIAVSVLPVTLISAVQGSGAASPLLGDDVAVEAVVTSTYTTDDALSGFFLQEEDGDADVDATTSEGIFVDCATTCPAGLAEGDLVRVAGRVAEDFAMTQLLATAPGWVVVVASDNVAPTAAAIDLPAAGRTDASTTFEAVEGMVTTFTDTLSFTEYFELARFGQIELTEGGRPYQFTHDNTPSVPGYQAFLDEQATRRIILDDDNDDQNDAISDGPDEPYPYPSPGLSTTNRVRGGDTITGLTGALEWSFGAWRLRPIESEEYTFASTNPAPARPVDVGGDLRVASFNVLNYFTTIDETSGNTGPCAPAGDQDCRGADSPAELAQQRAKIVAALATMDADVVGLIELQNDAGASVANLVDALNAEVAPYTYDYIDTGTIGTDAIKVAFIYRPSAVTPVGPFKVLTKAIKPDFLDDKNRPALIQTFQENATGERFTAAINHFKSKGSDCNDVGDPDLGDGQGNCSVTRTKAAQALADYLATDPTGSGDPDVIILGDLNSYREEFPITTLEAAGYTDLIERFGGVAAYGYLFDGQLGYLDHAFANDAMTEQVTGATEWHVNADEVPLFDYNDDVRTIGEAVFERESHVLELDATDALRSSDHDPVIVGLDLSSLTVDDALIVQRPRGGGSLLLSADVDGSFTACPTLALRVEGVKVFDGPTTRLGRTSTCVSLTSRGLVTFDLGTGAVYAALRLPSTFLLTDDVVTFALSVDGADHVVDRTGRRSGLVWTAD